MKKLTIALATVLAVLSAGLLGWIFWLEYGLYAIAVWAAMLVALPFSSLLHELGHMLCGAMCKIKAVPKFKLFGSSSCKIIPKTDKILRRKIMFTACGGLIINALLFIFGIVALYVDIIPVWLALLVPSNVYLYIMNAMPVEFNDKTDGRIFWELLSLNDNAKVMLAVLTVQAQVLKGKPIAEVDEQLLFGVPQIIESEQSFIALTELRYEYFKAKGETAQAEKYKARFEELKKEYL